MTSKRRKNQIRAAQRAEFGDLLEDLGDVVSDAGDIIQDVGGAIGKVVKAAAPFLSFIPGIGTLAGAAIYAVGSVAAGDRIDDVAINAVENALPANVRGAYRQAVDLGYAVGRGENVGKLALDLAREEARAQGGEAAVSAFDTGVAVGQGRGLQDAGFQLMGAWVQGNTAGERAVVFAKDVSKAIEEGKSTEQFLIDAGANQLIESVPAAKQVQAFHAAIQYLIDHPEVILEEGGKRVKDYIDWQAIVIKAGVPLAAIKSAITVVMQIIGDRIVLAISAPRKARVDYLLSMAKIAEGGFTTKEINKENNDLLAVQGYRISQTPGVYWISPGSTRESLADIRARSVWIGPTSTDDITDTWRRGFDIGLAVADGLAGHTERQDKTRASLVLLQAMKGFDAGQKIQFDRTMLKAAKGIRTSVSATTANKHVLATTLAEMNQMINMTPVTARQITRVRLSASKLAAAQSDQAGMCKSARAAYDRGSPAADGLGRQCAELRKKNIGAGVFITEPIPVSGSYRVSLTEGTMPIVTADPLFSRIVSGLSPDQQRGFAWGVGITLGSPDSTYLDWLWGKTWTTGEGATIAPDPQMRSGFMAGTAAAMIGDFKADASVGKLMSSQTPIIGEGRAMEDDPQYKWGYDIGIGYTVREGGGTVPTPEGTAYGDLLGIGMSGPNETAGSTKAVHGFQVGQALMHGINKLGGVMPTGTPGFQAGALITEGLSGSGLSGGTKAAIMQSAAKNADARAGAVAQVANKGFWAKILAFFGL